MIKFSPPTSVDLSGFTATSTPRAIQLDWKTAQESGAIDFNLYRADSLDGPKLKLNPELIPARDQASLWVTATGTSIEYPKPEIPTTIGWNGSVRTDQACLVPLPGFSNIISGCLPSLGKAS